MGNSVKSDSESLVNRVVCESDGKEIVSATLEVRPPQGVSNSEGKVVASGPTVVRPPKGGISDSHEKVKTVTPAEGSVATSKKGETTLDSLGVSPAGEPKGDALMQSVAKFIQAQTEMMAAQTKAMAAQSLPTLPHFSGEGNLVGDDSFDRWVEHFEERATVAGWSEEEKRYRLKMHLDKTAFQTYCMLPNESKESYSAAKSALRKRFQPVDIEELRGAEFYQIVQTNETVEELGIKLQTLARKAFPSLMGKECDRLLKGRFFQSLQTKWQRKLHWEHQNQVSLLRSF